MTSEVVDASLRLVTLHVPLEDVKEEVEGDGCAGDKTSQEKKLVMGIGNPSRANNNANANEGKGTPADVRIKDEPIDIDEMGTETFEIKYVIRCGCVVQSVLF